MGFTEATIRNIATRLQGPDWLELFLTSLEDRPEFFYRVDETQEIRFEEASPGQEATALLTVLLNQGGGPLIIDQPEEDLDNAIISRVVETIWSAKKRRQLIFASHNANLVVNGDAELIIHCDYTSADDRSAGKIACSGSIDEASVYYYFRRFERDGTWKRIHDRLRVQVRQKAGKKPTPSVGILDSQTVKTAEKGGIGGTTRARKPWVASVM